MIFGDLCATKKAKKPSEPLAVEAIQQEASTEGPLNTST